MHKNNLSEKKIITLLAIACFFTCKAQRMSSKDSISVFYDSVFATLKSDYLYKTKIDWNSIEPFIKKEALKQKTFFKSLAFLTTLFDTIKDRRCRVYYHEQEEYKHSSEEPTLDFQKEWIDKYLDVEQDFKIQVKIIGDSIGYILIPSYSLYSFKSKINENYILQMMYSQIDALKNSVSKGWIIDLRFNAGTSNYPALMMLYDFLGDTKIWSILNDDGSINQMAELNNGKYIENGESISSISPLNQRLTSAKVAIIIDGHTQTSGEVIAASFKGRNNTIFIGERTGGETITYKKKFLPHDIEMGIPVGFNCDRNNQYYEHIFPDVKVSKKDNFHDLLLDGNVMAAIEYFNKN